MDKVIITRNGAENIDFEALLDPKSEKTGDDLTDILLVVFEWFCAMLSQLKANTKRSKTQKERERYDNIMMDIHRVLDKIAKFD